jgi:hypothetical protein
MWNLHSWFVDLIAAMMAVELLQDFLLRQQIILEASPNQKVQTMSLIF